MWLCIWGYPGAINAEEIGQKDADLDGACSEHADGDSSSGDSEYGVELRSDPQPDYCTLMNYNLQSARVSDAYSRGVANVGNTCYVNALLRSLGSLSSVHAWARHHAAHCAVGRARATNCGLCCLCVDMAALSQEQQSVYTPLVATQRRHWAPQFAAGRSQQCAHEAFVKLMEYCSSVDEAALAALHLGHNKASVKSVPMWKIFGGRARQVSQCFSCGHEVTNIQYFNHVIVVIPEAAAERDLRNALMTNLRAQPVRAVGKLLQIPVSTVVVMLIGFGSGSLAVCLGESSGVNV